MTSQNKKRKCKNTLYSKGGEKMFPSLDQNIVVCFIRKIELVIRRL